MKPPEPGPESPTQSPPPENRPQINWLVFFLVLLAPAVWAMVMAGMAIPELAPVGPLIGSPTAGIYCGFQLARRISGPLAGRIVLGIVFSLLLVILSFALGFAGCALAGGT